MTRVSQADQLLLLLRERLQRLDRGRAERKGGAAPARPATPKPLERLHAVAALDRLSEEETRRSLVRALLAQELGDGIANDPGFQKVADDVFRIISESEEGRALIDRAASQLRRER